MRDDRPPPRRSLDDLIASVPAEVLDAARARADAAEVESRRRRETFDLCRELNEAGQPQSLTNRRSGRSGADA